MQYSRWFVFDGYEISEEFEAREGKGVGFPAYVVVNEQTTVHVTIDQLSTELEMVLNAALAALAATL
jgi:hypothetical protein